MGLLVAEKTGLLPKTLSAFEANKGFLPGVSSLVHGQVRVDTEGFVALGTLVRSFSSVRSQVDLEMVGFSKPLTAHLTPVGALSGVCPLMDLQVGALMKAFLANKALVRPLPRVDSLVDFQFVGVRKALPAVSANIRCRQAFDNRC